MLWALCSGAFDKIWLFVVELPSARDNALYHSVCNIVFPTSTFLRVYVTKSYYENKFWLNKIDKSLGYRVTAVSEFVIFECWSARLSPLNFEIFQAKFFKGESYDKTCVWATNPKMHSISEVWVDYSITSCH